MVSVMNRYYIPSFPSSSKKAIILNATNIVLMECLLLIPLMLLFIFLFFSFSFGLTIQEKSVGKCYVIMSHITVTCSDVTVLCHMMTMGKQCTDYIVVSQISFSHISINSLTILMVSMAPRSP